MGWEADHEKKIQHFNPPVMINLVFLDLWGCSFKLRWTKTVKSTEGKKKRKKEKCILKVSSNYVESAPVASLYANWAGSRYPWRLSSGLLWIILSKDFMTREFTATRLCSFTRPLRDFFFFLFLGEESADSVTAADSRTEATTSKCYLHIRVRSFWMMYAAHIL